MYNIILFLNINFNVFNFFFNSRSVTKNTPRALGIFTLASILFNRLYSVPQIINIYVILSKIDFISQLPTIYIRTYYLFCASVAIDLLSRQNIML